MRIAKIHYAHTRKFSKARTAARQAMKHKSNWGAPLILIGKLYASSGPLCGPGTGFKDIFSRPEVKEGGTFKVKCWIQESTKVRAAK